MNEPSSYFELFREDDSRVAHEKGEFIFKVGDPGSHMYVVTEGSVEMRIGDVVKERVEQGGVFGELELIDQESRSADAVAATDCQVVPIDSVRFQSCLSRMPFFGIEVMRVMAHRLRRETKR